MTFIIILIGLIMTVGVCMFSLDSRPRPISKHEIDLELIRNSRQKEIERLETIRNSVQFKDGTVTYYASDGYAGYSIKKPIVPAKKTLEELISNPKLSLLELVEAAEKRGEEEFNADDEVSLTEGEELWLRSQIAEVKSERAFNRSSTFGERSRP